MGDFVPEKMFSVDIQGKSDEVFCHDVKEGETPTMLRGAYFTGSGTGDSSIDFYILDENRRVVFNRRKKTEGIFVYNATKPGTYMFIFSNLKVSA